MNLKVTMKLSSFLSTLYHWMVSIYLQDRGIEDTQNKKKNTENARSVYVWKEELEFKLIKWKSNIDNLKSNRGTINIHKEGNY